MHRPRRPLGGVVDGALYRIGEVGRERPAIADRGRLLDLTPVTKDIDGDFLEHEGLAHARAAVPGLAEVPVDRVGAPIVRPGKVVCIGLNYRDHAAETGSPIPAEPVVFLKDPCTVIGPYDDVMIPRGSAKTDWEVELGVVIGRTARYLDSPAAAARVVAGYVISHDVSERAFQLERGGQWDKGKSCETFNPIGPALVPADRIADPQCLRLRLTVNGEGRQDGTTAAMVFGVLEVIAYLSQFMVLRPGDLVNTGTPAGVALGSTSHGYLTAGDVVRLEIDGLGLAEQRMVQA